MILLENKAAVGEQVRTAGRVLDVGGWFAPLNIATHVIDIQPYETRKIENALFSEEPERFGRDTWTVHDITQAPWPFPDNYFDFCFCSHLLEDVDDPITTCREMMRVSKAGYIETPSRLREMFTKEHLPWLKGLMGRRPEIGDPHHFWLVEAEDDLIRFTRKTDLVFDRRFCLSRMNVNRKLTPMESGLCLWWKDTFSCEVMPEPKDSDLANYKTAALKLLGKAVPAGPAGQGNIRETRRRALSLAITDKIPRLITRPKGRRVTTLIGSRDVLEQLVKDVWGSKARTAPCRWIVIGEKNQPQSNAPIEWVAIDSDRYRNSLVYRMKMNLMLPRHGADIAVCCTEEPDPMVEYAVLAAVPASERYVLQPRLKAQFQDDGAYYISRFKGVKPRAELIELIAAQNMNL